MKDLFIIQSEVFLGMSSFEQKIETKNFDRLNV